MNGTEGRPRLGDRWMQTFTGKCVDPLRLSTGDVCIEDIAHSLAMQCRFAGHCKEFYSVAEHSVRVSVLLQRAYPGDVPLLMLGLLHDAAEAYIPDIIRPMKPWIKINKQSIDDIESRILFVILEGLHAGHDGLVDVGHACEKVKHADMTLLATEARDLMTEPEKRWSSLPSPECVCIEPWSWEEARAAYFNRHRQLWQCMDRGSKTPAWDEAWARITRISDKGVWLT